MPAPYQVKSVLAKWARIKRDREGGIEGLPLQLMIMVVIAGIGTAIILGWMTNLQPPNSIGSVYSSPTEIILADGDGDGIHTNDGIDVVVTVLDQSGNGIEGASVILRGANIMESEVGGLVHGTTDALGRAEFNDLWASQPGDSIGFVTVTVTKSGYGTDSSLTIPVISA